MAVQEVTRRTTPNGPAAAALIAATIGCLTIGLFTTITEYSKSINNALNWYKPTGPLAGKVGMGVIAWLAAWVVLYATLKDKDPRIKTIAVWTFVLLALGFALTFPPIFGFFLNE